MTREGRREEPARVERDPVICSRCDEEGDLVATPAGPLCGDCADDLADDLR